MMLLTLVPMAAKAETTAVPSRWIGRNDPQSGRFGWPGSGVELVFTGTRLVAVLEDGGRNSLVVEVDGSARRIDLSEGRHSYPLAEGLAAGRHEVRLLRRTEGLFGATTFISATTDGRFLPGRAPGRRILVIGDSISAGYGIEGENKDCSFSADTENHYLTYAARLARRFDAELVTLAASGRGLSRNHDGSTEGTMPDLMDRRVPSLRRTVTSKLPEDRKVVLVIVHLGTNDFGGGRRPSEFEADYTALLNRLRDRHPSAVLYAAIGPMLAMPDLKAALQAIDASVERRRREGDTALRRLQLTAGAANLGCDWHPNAKAHRQMAEQLSEAIAEDLGWTP